MQKRKLAKTKEVDHCDHQYYPEGFMDEMMDDFAMHHSGSENATAQIASSAMSAAIELSKLVVENRIRNASNIGDDDIYNIYQKSFDSVIRATASFNKED